LGFGGVGDHIRLAFEQTLQLLGKLSIELGLVIHRDRRRLEHCHIHLLFLSR